MLACMPRPCGSTEPPPPASLLRSIVARDGAVQRVPDLPASLRGCIDHLTIEVAKVQGISEWIGEDLVRLVGE